MGSSLALGVTWRISGLGGRMGLMVLPHPKGPHLLYLFCLCPVYLCRSISAPPASHFFLPSTYVSPGSRWFCTHCGLPPPTPRHAPSMLSQPYLPSTRSRIRAWKLPAGNVLTRHSYSPSSACTALRRSTEPSRGSLGGGGCSTRPS
jgi:hypothetical protein